MSKDSSKGRLMICKFPPDTLSSTFVILSLFVTDLSFLSYNSVPEINSPDILNMAMGLEGP